MLAEVVRRRQLGNQASMASMASMAST